MSDYHLHLSLLRYRDFVKILGSMSLLKHLGLSKAFPSFPRPRTGLWIATGSAEWKCQASRGIRFVHVHSTINFVATEESSKMLWGWLFFKLLERLPSYPVLLSIVYSIVIHSTETTATKNLESGTRQRLPRQSRRQHMALTDSRTQTVCFSYNLCLKVRDKANNGRNFGQQG